MGVNSLGGGLSLPNLFETLQYFTSTINGKVMKLGGHAESLWMVCCISVHVLHSHSPLGCAKIQKQLV